MQVQFPRTKGHEERAGAPRRSSDLVAVPRQGEGERINHEEHKAKRSGVVLLKEVHNHAQRGYCN